MCDLDLIQYCSPTLAGMKCGSMFMVLHEQREDLLEEIRRHNQMFSPRGLCLIPLKVEEDRTLVYLFRPKQLADRLSDPAAARILKEKGYPCGQANKSLTCLIRHLKQDAQFPHEIGLFLGYPPEDVRGFMENRSAGKCCGCYRVYGDEKKAEKTFAKYDKCKKVYHRLFTEGRSLEQLTVASR